MLRTAIVILNWNGIDYLRKFLGDVVRLSSDESTKVYVADNGSDDGSAEWVESQFPEVAIIRLGKNHGFAGGYNLALEQTEAEYFVLLNSDIEVTKGWLQPLVEYMDQNPDVASCQPKIRSWLRREYFEYAGAAGGFIDRYGYPFCRGRIFGHVEKDTGQYDDKTDIFWSTGACMIIRASAWRKCGGFDSDFFAHMEEIDLCWRFAKAGYRVSYIPDSVVFHVGGGALHYESPFKTYLNFRNSLFLLYKNLEKEELGRIIFIRKILDGLAAIRFLLSGKAAHLGAVWKAHKDFNNKREELRRKREKGLSENNGNYPRHILNKSIVFEFYARGKKTFRSLNMKTYK